MSDRSTKINFDFSRNLIYGDVGGVCDAGKNRGTNIKEVFSPHESLIRMVLLRRVTGTRMIEESEEFLPSGEY